VDTDDVGMEQRGGHIGLACEALTELGVGTDPLRKDLQRFQSGQPRVLCEVDLPHSPGTQKADDAVPSKFRTIVDGHGQILTTTDDNRRLLSRSSGCG
jgi:hypothetical protein